MFSIYCSAITSMTNADCEAMLGQAKRALLTVYQQAAHQALVNAELLKSSDLQVLQAFVLYVVSLPCQLGVAVLTKHRSSACVQPMILGLYGSSRVSPPE